MFNLTTRADLETQHGGLLSPDERKSCEALIDEREASARRLKDRYNVDAIEDKGYCLADAMFAAETRMIVHTPAPDVAALADKMEVALAGKDEWCPSEDIVQAILADARRLAH